MKNVCQAITSLHEFIVLRAKGMACRVSGVCLKTWNVQNCTFYVLRF